MDMVKALGGMYGDGRVRFRDCCKIRGKEFSGLCC